MADNLRIVEAWARVTGRQYIEVDGRPGLYYEVSDTNLGSEREIPNHPGQKSLVDPGIMFPKIPPDPALQILGGVILESLSVGGTVATATVSNPKGSYTFAKTADPDSKFALSPSTGLLTLAAPVDYDTEGPSHSVTIQASNGVDTPLTRTLLVLVTNVIEGTLAPTTATVAADKAPGWEIATITGRDSGAAEVAVSVNDSRLAIASQGTKIVVGLGTLVANQTIHATVMMSTGRTLDIAVSVSSVAVQVPAVTTAPSLGSGSPQIGEKQTLNMGVWTNATSYDWVVKAAGTTIASGTTSSQTADFIPLGTSTVGKTLSATVTASNGGGPSTPAPSNTTPNTIAMATQAVPYVRGVNLSGAESGGSAYAYPDLNTVDYFWDRGARVFRIPFRAERLQPVPSGPLAMSYANRLKQVGDYITSKGGWVIYDPHNSAKFRIGATIDDQSITGGTQVVRGQDAAYSNTDYADFYTKTCSLLANKRAIFAFDNEPNAVVPGNPDAGGGDLPVNGLVTSINASIAAVRALGLKNLFLWNLNGYGLNGWGDSSGNWSAATGIVDSGANNALDIHFYVDQGGPGNDTSVDPTQTGTKLPAFTTTARTAGLKVHMGEIGVGTDATSLAALKSAIEHVEANSDVWAYGFSYWTAISYQNDYRYQSLPTERTNSALGNPLTGATTDRAQMAILAPVWQAPLGYRTTSLDATNKRASASVAADGLTATLTGGANADTNWPLVRSVANSTGLFAVEFAVSTSNGSQGVGIVPTSADVTTAGTTQLGGIAGAVTLRGNGAIVQNNQQIGSFAATADNLPVGTKILLLVDLAQGKLWATHSGVSAWNNSGADPAAGTGGISFTVASGAYHAAIEAYYFSITTNFGALPFHKPVPTTFLRLVDPQVPASAGPVTAPKAFAVAPKTNQPVNGVVESDPVTITGYTVDIPVTAPGAQVSVNDAAYADMATAPAPTAKLKFKTTAPPAADVSKQIIVQVGDYQTPFVVRTGEPESPMTIYADNGVKYFFDAQRWDKMTREYAYFGYRIHALKDLSGNGNDLTDHDNDRSFNRVDNDQTPDEYVNADPGSDQGKLLPDLRAAPNTLVRLLDQNSLGAKIANLITLGSQFSITWAGFYGANDGARETQGRNPLVGFLNADRLNGGDHFVNYADSDPAAKSFAMMDLDYNNHIRTPANRNGGSVWTDGKHVAHLVQTGTRLKFYVDDVLIYDDPCTVDRGSGYIQCFNNADNSPNFCSLVGTAFIQVHVGPETDAQRHAVYNLAAAHIGSTALPVTPYPTYDPILLLDQQTTLPFKPLKTTGAMTSGSNQLTVADATGFAQGDQIIVAIGGMWATMAPKSGGNTGNSKAEVFSKWPYLLNATAGTYTVRFTSSTQFIVRGPNNVQIGSGGTVDVEWNNQVAFLIRNSGYIPWVAGDGFDITLTVSGETEASFLDGKPAAGRLRHTGVGGIGPKFNQPTLAAIPTSFTPDAFLTARVVDPNKGPDHNKCLSVYQDSVTKDFHWNNFNDTSSHVKYAFPLALVAKITNIAGNVLTLDKPAQASTAGAEVWYDNSQAWEHWGAQGPGHGGGYYGNFYTDFVLGAGTFGFSRSIDMFFQGFKNCKFYGAGNDQTLLVKPRGTSGNMINTNEADNIEMYGFEYDCQYGDGNTYSCVSYADGVSNLTDKQLSVPALSAGAQWSGYKPYIHDVKSRNVFKQPFSLQYANGALILRCEHYQFHCPPAYTQWDFNVANSVDCVYQNCWSWHVTPLPTAEAFQCTGMKFINCGGVNCMLSDNSSGGTIFFRPFYINERDVNSYMLLSSGTNINVQYNPMMQTNTNADNLQNLNVAVSNITIGANAVVTTSAPHGLNNGDLVTFPTDGTTGTLPSPLVAGNTTYYVHTKLSATTLMLKATRNGGPITTSGSFAGPVAIRLRQKNDISLGFTVVDPVLIQTEYADFGDKNCRTALSTGAAANCRILTDDPTNPKGYIYHPDIPTGPGVNGFAYVAIRSDNPDIYVEGLQIKGKMSGQKYKIDVQASAAVEVTNCSVDEAGALPTGQASWNTHDNYVPPTAWPFTKDFTFDEAHPLDALDGWHAQWVTRWSKLPSRQETGA